MLQIHCLAHLRRDLHHPHHLDCSLGKSPHKHGFVRGEVVVGIVVFCEVIVTIRPYNPVVGAIRKVARKGY